MIQGTTSDAGKSLIVAGICRWLSLQGYRVAPFKPQNMSNNAVALTNGGEIGKAQALQAIAAKCKLTFDLNPILLKPFATGDSEIIIHGKSKGKVKSIDYRFFKQNYFKFVTESFERLKRQYEYCIIEGAGGASEINLRKGDIANMGFALPNKIPVILVADIERGGAIASLIGTWETLSKQEQDLVVGFWINKFKGNSSLFSDGCKYIENKIQRPCLGIIPWFEKASLLPAEDSLALNRINSTKSASESSNSSNSSKINSKRKLKIGIVRLVSISNFDEFTQLENDIDYEVEYLSLHKPLPIDLDWLIIPGTKSILIELQKIYQTGFHHDIFAFYRRGGKILGICGGYSILGNKIIDAQGKDGVAGQERGLGLLDISTVMQNNKEVVKRRITLKIHPETQVKNVDKAVFHETYEIHYGKVIKEKSNQPWIVSSEGECFGTVNKNHRVFGCYMHDLLVTKNIRDKLFLNLITANSFEQNTINEVLDAWSKHLFTYSKKGFIESILDLREKAVFNNDL